MEFKQAVVTQNGRALMAKLLAGKSTQFTKIKVSSMVYQDGQLETLTALTNIEQETTAQAYGNNTATVSVVGAIENTGLGAGYYINTVGLYAMDPDKGEILYSVSSASVNGYMPPDTGVSKSGFEFKIYTEVGNATKVDLTVDPAAFATHEDLERFKADYYNHVEVAELLAQIMSGEKIELTHTVDFTGKSVGSVEENPHVLNAINDPNLVKNPQAVLLEPSQSQYNLIMQLDKKSYGASWTADSYMRQVIFKWNIVEQINRDYPGIFEFLGAASLSEKTAITKKLVIFMRPSVYGYGSSPSGNKLSFTVWNGSTWSSSPTTNLTNEIKEMWHTWRDDYAGVYIQPDGYMYLLAYADPADGSVSSSVSIDYASVSYSLQFKLSDFYVPRNEYNQEIGEIKDWIQAHS